MRWWDGERWAALGNPLPTGKAKASFVMGVVGLVLTLPVGGVALMLAIPALVVGILALRDHRRGVAAGRELAIAGIVFSGLTFVFWIGIAGFLLMIS